MLDGSVRLPVPYRNAFALLLQESQKSRAAKRKRIPPPQEAGAQFWIGKTPQRARQHGRGVMRCAFPS
jgi:hypothetical protein